MNYSQVAFIDIDDTLVRTIGTRRIPIVTMVRKMRELFEGGIALYAWSSGGDGYARESCRELGIEDCFIGFLPKPNIMIDDQRVEEWRLTIQLHPREAEGLSMQEILRLPGKQPEE